MIYLDNAATTQVSAKLRNTIDWYLYQSYGNAGTLHALGQDARSAIDKARETVASKMFNTKSENIIFTSSGSEANTLAIMGIADYLKSINKKHIITSRYEHSSIMSCMKKLESMGFDVDYLDVANGLVSYDELKETITENTGLVSIMYVNNELGTMNDIRSLSEICKDKNIIFHTDCVQAAGFQSLDIDKLGVDMMSVSGHKIHAPKGVGCLCVRDKSVLSNIICGGEQEFGLRPGTENVAFISAFGIAVNEAEKYRKENIDKIHNVAKEFFSRLSANFENKCKDKGIHINASISQKRKTFSLGIDGIDAETLVLLLADKGVYVSAGSACSSHSSVPSYVLKAIGLTDEEARSTIRISFSKYNTIEEVQKAADILADCIKLLRNVAA